MKKPEMKISKAMRIRNKTNFYAIQFLPDILAREDSKQ